MLPIELLCIDEALLLSACSGQWLESQTLEVKQSLPGTDDKSRNEFLKDVCALANSSGGDILYGIREKSGRAPTMGRRASELTQFFPGLP